MDVWSTGSEGLPVSSGPAARAKSPSPWLLLPFPRVLVVGPDSQKREQLARLVTDAVELRETGGDGGSPSPDTFRPDLVLVCGANEGEIASSLATASALREDASLVVVLAAASELEAVALAAGADEVLLAGDSEAVNRRRLARAIEVVGCRKRDALFRQVLDCLECGIVVADATRSGHPLLLVNSAWERATGRDRATLLGRDAAVLQRPDTDPSVVEQLRAHALAGRKGRVQIQDRRRDGTSSTHELALVPIRNDAQRLTHFVGIRHDVTDRQKVAELERSAEDLEALVNARTRTLATAYEALEARGLFMETVLDAITAGVLAVDASSAVTLANRAALQILELTIEACVGVPVVRLLQSAPELLDAIASLLPGTERRIEAPYLTPSGRTIELGLSVIATRTSAALGRPGYWVAPESAAGQDRGGVPEIDRPVSYLILFRDLGVQRQFEVELRRANALTAIGQMAAGFAHEIRNPLAAIRSLSDNLLMELAEGDDRREYATRIVAMTKRLERFVRTSLRFAQPREPSPRPSPPLGLAEDALEVFAPRLKTAPAVPVIRGDPAAPRVFVDPDQVVEVLVALVENALDVVASPDHVRVVVEVAGPADGVEDGAYVAIEVADDGPGIPPELQARVFDPFFTTKPKGTGLGLSIVQRIVRNNKGHLRLLSRPGETRFRMLLPVAEP